MQFPRHRRQSRASSSRHRSHPTRLIAALAVLGGLVLAGRFAIQSWRGDHVAGLARVVDGDSIEIDGRRIRLWGIDAPELHQRCQDAGGGEYACGDKARAALASIVGDRRVACERQGDDRYGRMLARCHVEGGGDLATQLVAAGWALAYAGQAGDGLRALERQAVAARRGLWAGRFERPADWRRDHRRE
jgi:endonuclease YncB( thermonuclease family)